LDWARKTRKDAHHLEQALVGKEILYVNGPVVGFFVAEMNA